MKKRVSILSLLKEVSMQGLWALIMLSLIFPLSSLVHAGDITDVSEKIVDVLSEEEQAFKSSDEYKTGKAIEEKRQKIIELAEAFAGQRDAALLDTFGLLRQDMDRAFSNQYLWQDVRLNLIQNDRLELQALDHTLLKVRGNFRSVGMLDGMIFLIEDSGFVSRGTDSFHTVWVLDIKAYEPALGKTHIPMLRLPIATDEPLRNIEVSDGFVRFIDAQGRRALSGTPDNFLPWLGLQRMAFNLTASLADPNLVESTRPLVEELEFSFKNFMDHRWIDLDGQRRHTTTQTQLLKQSFEDLKQQLKVTESLAAQADKLKEIKKADLPDGLRSAALDQYFDAQKYAERLNEMKTQTVLERQFQSRLGVLWARLTVPQPLGATQIMTALAHIVTGFTTWDSVSRIRLWRQGTAELMNTKLYRYGVRSFVVGAMVVGAVYHLETAVYLEKALMIPAGLTDAVLGAPAHVFTIASAAAQSVFGGVLTVKEAYFNPETFPRLMKGMGFLATGVFMTIGIPHLIVNTVKLTQDMGRLIGEQWVGLNFWQKAKLLHEKFLEREQQAEKRYRDILAEAELRSQGLKASEAQSFSAEDEKLIDRIIRLEARGARLIADADLRGPEKFAAQQTASKPSSAFFSTVFHTMTLRTFQGFKNPEDINTTWKALRHFLFSYASWTNSGVAYAIIWNSWFAFRSFVTFPKLWMSMLLMPNAYSTIRATKVLPSRMNGGSRLVWQFDQWLKRRALPEIKEVEAKLIEAEVKIQSAVLKQTFRALQRFVEDQSEGIKVASLANKVRSISDSKLNLLNVHSRIFFNHYYSRLMDESLKEVLLKMPATQANLSDVIAGVMNKQQAQTMEELSLRATGVSLEDFEKLGELKARGAVARDLTEAEVDALKSVNTIFTNNSISDDVVSEVVLGLEQKTHIYDRAAKEAQSRVQLSMEATQIMAAHGMMNRLDPQFSRAAQRMNVVERKIKDPVAMARATRAMIAGNVVDKPMELVFLFVFLAGMQIAPGVDNLLRPVQDEFMSNTSMFYLSREVVAAGYFMGVVTGIFADVWMKIQLDEKNEGKLGQVPDRALANKSFVANYLYNFWKNPENSLWSNWTYYNKLIWANMRAALVTYAVFGMLTLGRFDLDSYLVGYFFSYLTPFSALAAKFEQAYEFSTGWFARNFPERLRSHPRVQAYLNEKVGRARLYYNFGYKIYENLLGWWLEVFQKGSVEGYGTRAFQRAFLGGFTVTEIFTYGVLSAKDATSWVPGSEQTCNGLIKIITNNYPSFEKIKP